MKNILIVVDMQNDFIDGALGTTEALAIVPYVKTLIEGFDGEVLFTRDTHFENYMETEEGRNLPVPHCIKGTHGWEIRGELDALRKREAIDKLTFGSRDLVDVLAREGEIESITFVGLCTDICVISNAMLLKAFYPEIPLIVDAKGCAGVTPESHTRALEAMKMCQIRVINE
jgi:nicotinamidase-related amidase